MRGRSSWAVLASPAMKGAGPPARAGVGEEPGVQGGGEALGRGPVRESVGRRQARPGLERGPTGRGEAWGVPPWGGGGLERRGLSGGRRLLGRGGAARARRALRRGGGFPGQGGLDEQLSPPGGWGGGDRPPGSREVAGPGASGGLRRLRGLGWALSRAGVGAPHEHPFPSPVPEVSVSVPVVLLLSLALLSLASVT